MDSADAIWPDLSYSAWSETLKTLHLWTQIVGKIRLRLTPWLNHSWQTSALCHRPGTRDIANSDWDRDFRHRVRFCRPPAERANEPRRRTIAVFCDRSRSPISIAPPSISSTAWAIAVAIRETPNEVPDPIRFSDDRTHAAYDAAAAHRFWRALVQADRLFKIFRSGFLGKASPVHFFWGSFDLAVTRFSGRRAPLHPGGVPGLPDDVAREAYSHEVSSAGFWPGNDAFPRAAFYSYAYPAPAGFRDRAVTAGSAFDTTLGEFILPYDTVARAPDPDGLLLDFLSTTYAAAADAGHWDRAALECPLGAPGRVRPI